MTFISPIIYSNYMNIFVSKSCFRYSVVLIIPHCVCNVAVALLWIKYMRIASIIGYGVLLSCAECILFLNAKIQSRLIGTAALHSTCCICTRCWLLLHSTASTHLYVLRLWSRSSYWKVDLHDCWTMFDSLFNGMFAY
jgi:hypothetical protein